jgi:hypothetical protein
MILSERFRRTKNLETKKSQLSCGPKDKIIRNMRINMSIINCFQVAFGDLIVKMSRNLAHPNLSLLFLPLPAIVLFSRHAFSRLPVEIGFLFWLCHIFWQCITYISESGHLSRCLLLCCPVAHSVQLFESVTPSLCRCFANK